jgi:hypothetical protein
MFIRNLFFSEPDLCIECKCLGIGYLWLYWAVFMHVGGRWVKRVEKHKNEENTENQTGKKV